MQKNVCKQSAVKMVAKNILRIGRKVDVFSGYLHIDFSFNIFMWKGMTK